MKIITMYLPQFHRTPENDCWWGNGFTEWTTVNGAESYFEGHTQPRKPLEGEYDLLEKNTMLRQADLMQQYRIYGQCFYHYWFKDGKMVLERPAENLLKWKKIHMPFCFSWANESWVRSWSARLSSNVWAQKYETEYDGDRGVLLEQEYGDEETWIAHIKYLIPFFQDERYIKVDGRPLFMIYRPAQIPCLRQMMGVWRQYTREAGFKDLYIIGANVADRMESLDASYIHAIGSNMPQNEYKIINEVKTIAYEKVWDRIITEAKFADDQTYVGGLVDFDTTPRKGKSGVAVVEVDAKQYEKYLCSLLAINEKQGKEFTFLNAWNEWGESMYLEPDTERSFSFLEATRNAMEAYSHVELDTDIDDRSRKLVRTWRNIATQNRRMAELLERWVSILEKEERITDRLYGNGIRTIAIYGLGQLGAHLQRELMKENADLRYVIDQRKRGVHNTVPVYDLNDVLPPVDAVIVTVLYDFEKIESAISHAIDTKIIFLDELLFGGEAC